MSDRKTVNFAADELELLRYAISQNKPFATYVKELIRQDMNKETLDEKIERKIEAYFNKYLRTHEISATKQEIKFTTEDKNDLLEFMKR